MGVRSRTVAALILGALTLAGCGEPRDEPSRSLSCSDLSLERDHGAPLDVLTILGSAALPVGESRIEVVDETGSGRPVLWRRDDDGTVVVPVPLHPSGRLEGGLVRLLVRAPGTQCDLGTLTIDPLAPAPGSTGRVVDALQAYIGAQAWHFGATLEALQEASPDTLLPPLVPLYLAQAVLDHPENPNSLRAVLDGRSPYFDGDADLSLLDALYGRSDVTRTIGDLTTSAAEAGGPVEPHRSSAVPPQPTGPFRFASLNPVPVATPPRLPRQDPQEWGQLFHRCPIPGDWYKPTARELSCWMHLSMNGDFMTSGKAKDTFDMFTFTLGVGSTLPVPIYREGMVIAGAAAFIFQKAAEATANVLPRTLETITVQLDPASFEEDYYALGSYDPIEVTASSKGWNTATSAIEALLQVFGARQMKSGMTPLSKMWQEAAEALPDKWIADYGGFVVQTLFKKGILPKFPGGGEGEDNPFNIPSQKYGPTDITDREWSEVKIEGTAIRLVGRPTYEPNEVGTATLIAWTKPLKFGDQTIRGEFALEVKPILVTISPAERLVEAGETVTLTATVENAIDKRLEWSVTPEEHRVIWGGQGEIASVITSGNPDHFPAIVRATSRADRSHLRVKSEAYGVAKLVVSRISLEPEFACVEPGDSQRFDVVLPDLPEIGIPGGRDESGGKDFRWKATHGSVSSRGDYRAPEPGRRSVDTLVVEDREDPRLTAKAHIQIGGCECWFTATAGSPLGRVVSGLASFALPDDDGIRDAGFTTVHTVSLTNMNPMAAMAASDRGAAVGDIGRIVRQQFQLGFGAKGLRTGGTGTFTLTSATFLSGWYGDGEIFMAAYAPNDPWYGKGGGSVTITERSDRVLAGWMGATLVYKTERSYATIPVRATFRAVTGSLMDHRSDFFRCAFEAAGL
jgi:hypothetical protein